MKKTLFLITFSAVSIFLKGQNPNDLDSLLKVVKTQKDTSKLSTLLQIGKIYKRKGLHDSSLYYLNPGLEFAKQNGTKKQICAMLLAIGESKSKLSQYDEALENLFSILKTAENNDIGEVSGKAKKEIGAIYIYQKKEKEALPYLFEAESELQKLNDTLGLFTVYSNLPVCIALLGDTVRAMTYFNKGFGIVESYAKDHPSKSSMQMIMNFKLAYTYNMINFLSKKEDLDAAFSKMQLLEKEVMAGTNTYQQFILFGYLADITMRLKLYEKAQSYGEQALKYPEAEGNYTYLMDIYWILARASASLKQYEKAYHYLISHRENGDSVFNFSQIEAVNSVEVKYKVEKKEQEIITLNKEKKTQNLIIGLIIGGLVVILVLLGFVMRSKRLQKKLFDRDKEIQKKEMEQKMAELEQTALRAQMNPHFIFNCLNSIQRYVISNDAEGVNHYLSTFANLIRQTLENSGKKQISLKDEIRYLETYIKMEQLRSNNSFEYYINVNPDLDQSGTYIPNMIVQPFVENSIHHGMLNTKDNKCMLRLDFSKNNKLTCIVDDNGPGIKNKSSLRHNEEEGHTSMGGAITEKRIEMYNSIHEAKIELQVTDKSDAGGNESGTRVILKFPLNN